MEEFNIQSGDEYADLLIENLLESNREFKELDPELMEYWEKEIRKMCNKRYNDYVKGKDDSYLLSEEDMLETYRNASLKLTGDILAKLVDKGEVKMGINDQGEIVYAAKDWDMIKNKKNKL